MVACMGVLSTKAYNFASWGAFVGSRKNNDFLVEYIPMVAGIAPMQPAQSTTVI